MLGRGELRGGIGLTERRAPGLAEEPKSGFAQQCTENVHVTCHFDRRHMLHEFFVTSLTGRNQRLRTRDKCTLLGRVVGRLIDFEKGIDLVIVEAVQRCTATKSARVETHKIEFAMKCGRDDVSSDRDVVHTAAARSTGIDD